MIDRDGPGWVQPSNDAVRVAAGELVALVDARLPQRFYRSAHRWDPIAAAMIVRMAETVESLIALMDADRPLDGLVLLRALYEQVVVFCWVSIDPETRPQRWVSNAHLHQRKLHNDALAFGQEILTAAELAETVDAAPLPGLADLAAAVDEHWGGRIVGFRPPQRKPGDILTLRGLYVAIYRMGSRAAHVQPESLDPYVDFQGFPRRVRRPATADSIWWPLAVPFYAQALLVCHDRLGWPNPNTVGPNPDRVRAINNAMYAQDSTRPS